MKLPGSVHFPKLGDGSSQRLFLAKTAKDFSVEGATEVGVKQVNETVCHTYACFKLKAGSI